jgi:hypothetical protein
MFALAGFAPNQVDSFSVALGSSFRSYELDSILSMFKFGMVWATI